MLTRKVEQNRLARVLPLLRQEVPMFGMFKSSARRVLDQPVVEQDQGDAAAMLAKVALPFQPMRPLTPPAAQNEDLEHLIYEAVKNDLREAGCLTQSR